MSNPNLELIQLQEQKATTNYTNGSWTNDITGNNNLFLENNDVLTIKNAFIDSPGADNITLDEDTDLKLTHTWYVMNNDDSDVTDLKRNYTENTNGSDFKAYVPCAKTTNAGTQYRIFQRARVAGKIRSNDFINFKFQYEVDGVKKLYTNNVAGQELNEFKEFNLVINAAVDLLSPITDLTDYSGPDFSGTKAVFDVENFTANQIYNPITAETTINIPSGTYQAQELAHIITSKLSQTNNNGVFTDAYTVANPVQNNLFTTNLRIQSTFNGGHQVFYCATDGSDIYVENAPIVKRFIGCPAFVIEYGDEIGINKFMISQSHSPLYFNGNTVIKKSPSTQVNGDFNLSGASSGILITQAEPSSLFEDIMGFGPDLYYRPEFKLINFATPGIDQHMPVISDVDFMKKTTRNFIGCDYVIDKTITQADGTSVTQDFAKGKDYEPTLNFNEFEAINSNQIEPVFATNTVSTNKQHNEPYYMVNVNVMNNKFYGSSNNKNVSCLVGNYYNINSYILSQVSDSVPYIHTGEPIALSNLKVSILDKDGKNSDSIGDKSHIILQLQKAEKQ